MQIKKRILNFLCCTSACAGDHLGKGSTRHNCWIGGKLQIFFFDVGETGWRVAGGATDGTNVWFRSHICISLCPDGVPVHHKCTGASSPHLHICNLGARVVWTGRHCPHSLLSSTGHFERFSALGCILGCKQVADPDSVPIKLASCPPHPIFFSTTHASVERISNILLHL